MLRPERSLDLAADWAKLNNGVSLVIHEQAAYQAGRRQPEIRRSSGTCA